MTGEYVLGLALLAAVQSPATSTTNVSLRPGPNCLAMTAKGAQRNGSRWP